MFDLALDHLVEVVGGVDHLTALRSDTDVAYASYMLIEEGEIPGLRLAPDLFAVTVLLFDVVRQRDAKPLVCQHG